MGSHYYDPNRGGRLLYEYGLSIGLDVLYKPDRQILREKLCPKVTISTPSNWLFGHSKPAHEFRVHLEKVCGIPYESWEIPEPSIRDYNPRKAKVRQPPRFGVKWPVRGPDDGTTNRIAVDAAAMEDSVTVGVTTAEPAVRPSARFSFAFDESSERKPMTASDWQDWLGGEPTPRVRSTWDRAEIRNRVERDKAILDLAWAVIERSY